MNKATQKMIGVFQNDTDGARAAYLDYRAKKTGYSSYAAQVWLDVVRPQLKTGGVAEEKLVKIETATEWKIVDEELNKVI